MLAQGKWILFVRWWKRSLSRATEPRILFPAIAALALAAIWATTLNLITFERTAAENSAVIVSRELGETYEAQVVRALREIDQTLKFIKYTYELRGKQEVLQELKAKGLLPPDLLFVVSIADSQGNIVDSTRPSAMTSIADQDYFLSQMQTDALSVGRPQQSPGSTEWSQPFSRRLNAVDGRFAGIVTVSVDAAYFVSGYESSKLGERGVLGVLGTDGQFRSRRSGDTVSAGDRVDYAAVVSATENADSGGALSTNAWDGVSRYTSALQLYDFPLAVIVGLSEEEQLAATRKDARAYLWRAGAGSLLLILIGAALRRMSQQLADARSQLLHSEKMASVGQLAAGVAHEINNPIAFVRSNLNTLGGYVKDLISILDAHDDVERASDAKDVKRHALSQLRKSIDVSFLREDIPSLLNESFDGLTRVENIVNNLKEFTHLNETLWQSMDIHQGLENTLNVAAHEIRSKAEIVREYGDLPPIECVPAEINQVFLNLLINAAQAHADGTRGTITLRTGHDPQSIWVQIADTGEGIEPAHIGRIFDPFFTTKPIGVGPGLGLSVSYRIVAKHGGTIDVTSELGKGSTFTVRLPIRAKGAP